MDNNIKTHSGERLSFYKLFTEKKYRVVIPIIQRDYAQGRKSQKDVRDIFLDALYQYLEDNKPNRDLDFVYGSLKKTDSFTDFIPLDGQQRLTTLFLLHWYLCQISDNAEKKEEFKSALLKDAKSMFTYETRSSSSEFCDALIVHNIYIDNLLKFDKDSKGNSVNNRLSKTIKNCSWFYLSWQYDPTIQSMLTMLDSIHKHFNNRKEFFERLLDKENPIITFLFLNLKDFKLTDDLYIKMNSRGKPLTPFENFKAKFEQYIEEMKPNRKLILNFNGTEKEVSLREYFSFNIDTKWANLFWNYRSLQNRSNAKIDDTFDDELMNFIRVIFTFKYATNLNILSRERDNTLEYLLGAAVAKKNIDYFDIITFHKYQELNVLPKEDKQKKLSENYVLYLIDAFDGLVNGNENIKSYISEDYKFYYDENIVFENALKHYFQSYHERLSFYAYIGFLIKNKDKLGINQWMRVIHNLSHPDNTIIDSALDFANAIKSIDNLLEDSNAILHYLKQESCEISLFSSWQVLEEKIKAHLITKNNDWKNKIEEIEKHGYFNGQIEFVLEFAGIVKYFNTHNNCNWNPQEDKKYFNGFSNYADKASKIFEKNYDNRRNDEYYIFERAVLTKGDYLTTASQYRKNLLSTNLVKNNIKRDHSWKRFLRVSNDESWKEKRFLVKNIFDDERFDKDDIKKSLKSICEDNTESWRDYLITCPNLIEYCKQGFIRFENENNILLYSESQSNHYHTEMYSYYLWKEFIEPKISFYTPTPFKKIRYKEVRSIGENACIVFEEYCHNGIKYEMHIYYKHDNLQNPYEIKFLKLEGENSPEKYGDDIKEILNKYSYSWHDECERHEGCFSTRSESDELISKLNEITNELNKIK